MKYLILPQGAYAIEEEGIKLLQHLCKVTEEYESGYVYYWDTKNDDIELRLTDESKIKSRNLPKTEDDDDIPF